MRSVIRLAGWLLLPIGLIWFFQGIGLLPGSFMTGDMLWARIGAATAAVGTVLLGTAKRR
jgi:hypothetical protein